MSKLAAAPRWEAEVDSKCVLDVSASGTFEWRVLAAAATRHLQQEVFAFVWWQCGAIIKFRLIEQACDGRIGLAIIGSQDTRL